MDEATLDPAILGYFGAYKKFRSETGFAPAVIEKSYYSTRYGYAGTVDRIGTLKDWAIVDIKSGQPFPTDPIQLIAYAHLIDETSIHKMFNLYLHDDGNYKLIDRPKRRADFNLFLCALQVWRFRNE